MSKQSNVSVAAAAFGFLLSISDILWIFYLFYRHTQIKPLIKSIYGHFDFDLVAPIIFLVLAVIRVVLCVVLILARKKPSPLFYGMIAPLLVIGLAHVSFVCILLADFVGLSAGHGNFAYLSQWMVLTYYHVAAPLIVTAGSLLFGVIHLSLVFAALLVAAFCNKHSSKYDIESGRSDPNGRKVSSSSSSS